MVSLKYWKIENANATIGLKVWTVDAKKLKKSLWQPGRFPFRKKTPEISMGAKVEFPIDKKLFHLVVRGPGTSRCPTVDLELVQTTRNVNGTRHSVRKFQPGKRAHLFRFSTFSGNFSVGWTDRKFWLNGKRPGLSRFFSLWRTCKWLCVYFIKPSGMPVQNLRREYKGDIVLRCC